MDGERVTYDRVLLLDLYPNSDYPHVTVVSFRNVGIPVPQLEVMKMTRDIRLQPRALPIYGPDDSHVFYIIAKMESDVDRTEEGRAATAVNEFIKEHLRAGIRLVDIPDLVVSNFCGRVQRRVYYVRKAEMGERHMVPASKSRKRPPVSSSDPETLLNANKKQKMDLRFLKKDRLPNDKPAVAPNPIVTVPPPKPPTNTAASQLFTDNVGEEQDDLGGADEHEHEDYEPETQLLRAKSAQPKTGLNDSRIAGASSTPKSKPSSSIPSVTSVASPGAEKTCMQCLNPVLERCESLNAKIDRTHKKLAQGLRVNVNMLDKVQKDVAEIKRAITSLMCTTAASQNTTLEKVFPLKVAAEVEQYLADDPSAALALQKWARSFV